MDATSDEIQLHHQLARAGIRRALAAHQQFAQGNGVKLPPVITVMQGGTQTHWLVAADGCGVTQCAEPRWVIGAVNLRVFDETGENDQPLRIVADAEE